MFMVMFIHIVNTYCQYCSPHVANISGDLYCNGNDACYRGDINNVNGNIYPNVMAQVNGKVYINGDESMYQATIFMRKLKLYAFDICSQGYSLQTTLICIINDLDCSIRYILWYCWI